MFENKTANNECQIKFKLLYKIKMSIDASQDLSYNVAQFQIKEGVMTANTIVRARINEQIKEEASAVLAAIGLTVSDAFRILLTRVAKDKAFPIEPLIPNEKTIAAMRDARSGKLIDVGKIDNLLESLNADD